MSRKSDIAQARDIYMATPGYKAIDNALEAAFDLGRASGLAEGSREWCADTRRSAEAKRLRAKVRKAGETR